MSGDLFIHNARLPDGRIGDVEISAGLISRIGPRLDPVQANVERVDAEQALLLPGFVDGHMHLDKSLYGLPWVPHRAGPAVSEKIEAEKEILKEFNISVEDQAARLIRLAISKGTTHIRTHVDIDTEKGLRHLEGVLAACETLKEAVSIQFVAFPQSGVMRDPGTAELLEEALRSGADLVGGVDPAGIDSDPKGQLDAIFGIAQRHGVGVDIHLHDPGELGLHQIGLIARYTQEHGLGGRVVVSHAFSLGTLEAPRIAPMGEMLAENGIAIMTTGFAHTPVPPVHGLLEAGVTVFAASDNIRDSWSPFGNADQLERAMMVAQRFNSRTDQGLEEAFSLVTHGGARALGLEHYGLNPGCGGDAVLVEGTCIPEAVVTRPPRKLVVKAGKVVARDGVCLV